MVPSRCQRNPHFTGRTALLKTLRDKLCDESPKKFNHRVSLSGMGGIGKTQVAIEYVFRHKINYDSVFWITAANQADFLQGFREIALFTKCVTTNTNDPDAVAKSVLRWLERQRSWLLVLDNVDEISVVQDCLPDVSTGEGHLLITSRDPNAIGLPAEGLEVELFEIETAADLLLLRANITQTEVPQSRAEAVEIVTELGCLALAIEQAAAFIRECLKDIFKFMKIYVTSRQKILSKRPKGNWDYPREVATTWTLSFHEVERRNLNAARLLKLFAFLNPDGILVEFLEAGRRGLPESLDNAIGDIFEFGRALSDLEQFSLIRRSINDGNVITTHRLIQAVIKDNMMKNEKEEYMGMVVAMFATGFPEFEEGRRALCRRYQRQVVGPLMLLEELRTDSMADMALSMGHFLSNEGNYHNAGCFHRMAVEIYSELFGKEDIRTLRSMSDLSHSYSHLGQMQEAADLRKKVLKIQERILGAEHPDTLRSMNNLASSYSDLGRIQESVDLREKVLKMQERILGAEHPDTLRSMNNLAASYSDLGRIQESVDLREKVLKMQERILGAKHPDTLRSMNNLAASYSDLGRIQEAVDLDEKVLKMQERIHGAEHPDTLMSMNNLAASYSDLGRIQEAVDLREKVLKMLERILGAEHPDTLRSMNNLASSYSDLGRIQESVDLREKVLKMQERILGAEHPDTLRSMNNLASSYSDLGRIQEAVGLGEKVLKMQERILGAEHPDTLTSMNNLAASYSDLGRIQEAVDLREKVLKMRERILGAEHPDTLRSMNNLAVSYSDLGRIQEAADLYEKALKMAQRILSDHPHTLSIMYNLAKVYWILDRQEDAVVLFEKELNGCCRLLGIGSPSTLDSMRNLASKYHELGREDDTVALEMQLEQAERSS